MPRRLGRRGLLDFAGRALATCRDWTTATFASEQAHGLLAPWVLHTGLGPENAVSGFMTQVIACALQLGGMPVPVGGGVRLVDALAGVVREAGGEAPDTANVERITVAEGRATGVVLADGEAVAATPPWSPESPRPSSTAASSVGRRPADVRRGAARYRYGRAGMQIHLALDEPPRWKGPDAERLARTAIVHVTPGLDGVSRAVNEAERGLLPAEATIVTGQPCAVDPSRAPEGRWIVWIQLQELPGARARATPPGSSTSETEPGRRSSERPTPTGSWAAGRVDREPLLGHAPAHRPVPRRPRGPEPEPRRRRHLRRELRPRPEPHLAPVRARPGHRTTIEGLWHVGASTHPGPGLGAGSGYLVAKELTKPPLTRRLVAKLPGRS